MSSSEYVVDLNGRQGVQSKQDYAAFKAEWVAASVAEARLQGVAEEKIEGCRKLADSDRLAFLGWSGVSVRAGSKLVLDAVSGFAEPKRMLAIMGPSGSGKTSLLEALAGRLPRKMRSDGQVLLNGRANSLSYGTAAYVTQDDLLMGTLTVDETLTAVADLRLPASYSRAQKQEVVDNIVRELGLQDARKTFVGNWMIRGLSGGQRRRVSLACELIVQPNLLFLDEVTSGLDAAASYHVMRHVKALAMSCRTVMTVIHQPSSEVFHLFDNLCLLAGGRVAYFGSADAAPDIFAASGLPVPNLVNPADHFLHCINGDFSDTAAQNVEALQEAYEKCGEHEKTSDMVAVLSMMSFPPYSSSMDGPSWASQTLTLTKRSVLNMTRDAGVFWLRLGMYLMLCLCLGFVFFRLDHSWKSVYSRAALLFFVVGFLTFMAIGSFPAFVEEMKVFVRERLNGYYGVSQFAVANTLSGAPFIFLIAALSSIPVIYLAQLNTDSDRVIFYILNLFLALLVTESLFMAIAPLLPHYLMGIVAGAGLMGLFMIVCGFFQPTAQLPRPVFVWPLHYMSMHTYSFDAFMHNEFDGTDSALWGCPCSSMPQGCGGPCTYSSSDILSYYSIASTSKWIDLVILLSMVVFYRFWFVCSLKLKERLSK